MSDRQDSSPGANGDPRDDTESSRVTYVAARPTVRITLPDGWARALLIGAEAAFVGWALSALISLVTYFGISHNPWMGEASWNDAFTVSFNVWNAVLGGTNIVGDTSYRAVPTLMTLFVMLMLRGRLVGVRHFPPAAHWFAIPGFFILTALLFAVNASHIDWGSLLPGLVLVPFFPAAWAYLSYRPREETTGRLPLWARRGLSYGALTVGALALVSTLFLGVAILRSWDSITGIYQLLSPEGRVDPVMIVIAHIAFAPTIIAWMLSWIAGPGFSLGPDAIHTPGNAPIAPIPPAPILGILPSTPWGYWVVLFPILIGVSLGVVISRRMQDQLLREQGYTLLATLGASTVILGVWMWSAQAYLGVNRMAAIGPRTVWVLLALLVELGISAATVMTLTHHTSYAWMRGMSGKVSEAAKEKVHKAGEKSQKIHEDPPVKTETLPTEAVPDDAVTEQIAVGDGDNSAESDHAQETSEDGK
ncbi:MAG: hypothetical protein CSA82_01080 [Actinobacteria bacterium]|nr:MAG: hypothetical protein CSA82_01080 [Actinomycetota bacterium]